jgi:hypothetical protein
MLAMTPEEIEPFPEPQLRDRVREGFDVGTAALPIVGGPLQLLGQVVLAPSLTRRREAWLRQLAELLNELSNKVEGWNPAHLAGDEVFVTALADASRIAMGTHLEEKLTVLKNCLAHMALPDRRNDFLDLQLFGLVEALAPEHLLVLQYLSNPGAWFDAKQIDRPDVSAMSPRTLLLQAELPVAGMALDIVLRQLSDQGLADITALDALQTAHGAWQSRTSELGRELLAFVSEI